MKKNKKIIKLSKKAVNDCFIDGKLDESRAKKYLNLFSSLPKLESLRYLTGFRKQLLRIKMALTLVIESSTDLTNDQLAAIKKKFGLRFTVTDVQQTINPSLLGGVRIKIGDMVFDDSVENKIQQLKGAMV
jgi:F0F1-type ATP synthase delta subunit